MWSQSCRLALLSICPNSLKLMWKLKNMRSYLMVTNYGLITQWHSMELFWKTFRKRIWNTNIITALRWRICGRIPTIPFITPTGPDSLLWALFQLFYWSTSITRYFFWLRISSSSIDSLITQYLIISQNVSFYDAKWMNIRFFTRKQQLRHFRLFSNTVLTRPFASLSSWKDFPLLLWWPKLELKPPSISICFQSSLTLIFQARISHQNPAVKILHYSTIFRYTRMSNTEIVVNYQCLALAPQQRNKPAANKKTI